jgi:hypothetical protein
LFQKRFETSGEVCPTKVEQCIPCLMDARPTCGPGLNPHLNPHRVQRLQQREAGASEPAAAKFVTLLNSCIADDCSGKVGRRQARHVSNRKSVKEVAASGQEHVKSALLRRAAAAPFDLGIDKIRSGNCET